MGDSSLIIRIGADASGVKKGVEDATVSLKGLSSSSVMVAHDMVELAEKAIAAGKALAEFLLGSSMENIDSQAKLARNIGSSIDGLRALQLYAKDAGISAEGLANATAKLNQTIGQGLAGNDKAVAALNSLYLSGQQLQGLDADEKMATLADAVRAAGLSTEQTLVALKDLGIKGGTELVDAMRMGGDAIRSARKEVEQYGLSLSDVDAAKVEAANDSWDRVKLSIEAVQNRIAITLAPILKALADKFNNVAKETHGFQTVADTAISSVITGVKIAANAIQLIRIGFKGAELAAAAIGSAIMGIVNVVVQLGATILDAVTVPLNGWIMLANEFGANIKEIGSAVGSNFAMGMHAATDAVEANVAQVYTELSELVSQPLPSTAIDDFISKAQAAAQAQAAAATAAQPGNSAVDTFLAGEGDRAAAFQLEIDENAAFDQMRLDAMQGFQDRMAAIQSTGNASAASLSAAIKKQQVTDVTTMASQVLSAYSGHSKKMFEANKALNIGMAIMNTFKGVSESLATYPMPLAAVMAALHLAMGLANVANIRSQQFGSTSGGGGSSGAGAAATAAAASSASEAPGKSGSTLMVQGIDNDSLFSGSMVRNLAERLSQHTADGGKLVIV